MTTITVYLEQTSDEERKRRRRRRAAGVIAVIVGAAVLLAPRSSEPQTAQPRPQPTPTQPVPIREVTYVYRSLDAYGPPPPAQLAVEPLQVSFGEQLLGSGATRLITIRNAGGHPLALRLGAVADGFKITQNCPAALLKLEQCAAAITFAPTREGLYTGNLTIDGMGTTQTIALSGFAFAPKVATAPTPPPPPDPPVTATTPTPAVPLLPPRVEPRALHFTSEGWRPVVISNPNALPIRIDAIEISNDALGYRLANEKSCLGILRPDKPCTFRVLATRTALHGRRSVQVTVYAGGTTATVAATTGN